MGSIQRLSTFIIIAVLLGSLFRLTNLSGKVYWHDETYTGLYVTGHGNREAIDTLFNGQMKTAADVLVLQTATPERGLGETIRQLAINDAQHPPLYYLLARALLYGLDDTIFATRLVAAIAGILLIPAVYWFSLELFHSSLAARVSAALVAVSPFHYLYAQEAREYSLWALILVISSAALLKALRKNNLSSWIIYAVGLTASLYSCILTFLIIASHCLYVVSQTLIVRSSSWEGRRVTLRNFTLSTAVGLLLFVPWLGMINEVNAASWTAQPMPIVTLGKIWAGNLTRIFFDLNLDAADPLAYVVPPVLFASGLTVYTLLWGFRHFPKSALLFLSLLGGVSLLAFVGPDLIFGGRRSSVSRYFMPTYLSLQMAIAYLLSQKITCLQAHPFWQTIWKNSWQSITIGLLIAGVFSCSVSLSSDTWWHKKNSHLNPAVARLVNQAPGSLLISSNYNANLGEILSLSHLFAPTQALLLFKEPEIPTIPDNTSTLFLFNISQRAREQLDSANGYHIVPLYTKGRLWQLKRQ